MNEIDHFANLNNTAAQINRVALAAFTQMLADIAMGTNARSAVSKAQQQFNGEYEDELLRAFNALLVSSIGKAELREMTVGDVTLSDRLYENSRQVTATTVKLIEDHVQGFQNARELALRLYEGYEFRKREPLQVKAPLPKYLRAAFGDDEAFADLWNSGYVGRQLRALADDALIGPELAQLYARLQANQLKTPALKAAYLQALDALRDGSGIDRLTKQLKVAFYERNRYFANRIAQTELHRAFTDQTARDLMQDTGFEVVQYRLSATHPELDICDYHARIDLYGLGPGIYPKSQCPKPPLHPFCRCLLAPLAGTFEPKYQKKAGIEYLNGLSRQDGRAVAGSYEKLDRLLNGETIDAVSNTSSHTLYHLKRLGDFEPHVFID